jgi:Na+-translocating ferredoxin:NAD+ oxidoreductase subunit D
MTIPAVTHGPHIHNGNQVGRIMRLVMLALVPATLMGLYQFGWPAILLFLATCSAAVAVEALCLRVAGRPATPTLSDGSALLTGWLLALTLPPWAPWWIGVLGAALAILLAKQVFGGLGQNPFNPAMAARVALLISFPLEMTTFPAPRPLFAEGSPGLVEGLHITLGTGAAEADAQTAATALGHVRTEVARGTGLEEALATGFDPLRLFLGDAPGSLGETSALLLLLGGLFLLGRRVITWHIPVAMLGSLALGAGLLHLIAPERFADPSFHLLSGATLLVAFFIATDPVTSPVSVRGQLLFGAGCGLLVLIIRTWAGYPEGAAFAVLLMNACTPLIDHFLRPRIYGRDRRGSPLAYADEEKAR